GGIAYGAGGAIANQNGATMSISGSTFNNNLALTGLGFFAVGGAIDNDNGIFPLGATLTIVNSTFVANEAQRGPRTSLGGALFSFLGSLSVSGCGFVHNVASSTRFAESGALDNEVCLATITNCSFVANEALGSFGGSAAAGALTNLQSTMTLSNC